MSLRRFNKEDCRISLFPVTFLLLWSNGFIFLKLGLRYSDPFTFLALRYFCVVVVLVLLTTVVRPHFPATLRGWAPLVGVGLFLQTGYFAFTYLGLRYGLTAGVAAVVTCQQPILIGLLAPVLVGEKVNFVRWTGLILGVTGAVIVIVANSGRHDLSPLNLTFAILALLSITCSTLIEKRFPSSVHPVSCNLVQYTIGFLIIAPLAFSLEKMQIVWTWQFLMSLIYLVFGASLLAISLLLAMIRSGEASRVAALFFLVPPVTSLVAFLFLGESLTSLSLLGMALAGTGIYIVMRKS